MSTRKAVTAGHSTARAAEAPPKAYSYVRFSTPAQAAGDSFRRQNAKAQAYAATHGLELNTDLKLQDLGVSAFRSLNAKTGALSEFLQAVRDGIVPAGSHLLIENIDRLTRDDIPEATELFLGLIRAGIVIVTLTNGFSYSRDSLKADPFSMLRRVGCKPQTVRYTDVEQAMLQNIGAIMEDAPRGQETGEIDAEIANLDVVEGVITDEARGLADELLRERSGVVRARLREKETELDATRERLRSLRARRDTLARPYVLRRLKALEKALKVKPFNVVKANAALKEAASKLVINPETGELTIYWHHAEQPSEVGTFWSRHIKIFDDDGPSQQGDNSAS